MKRSRGAGRWLVALLLGLALWLPVNSTYAVPANRLAPATGESLAAGQAGSLGSHGLDSAVVVPPEAAAQRTTLRVGLLPVATLLGLYVANERGWFDEEGLAVDLQVMTGGAEIIAAMIGGSLDIGISNVLSHVLARDQGFDVRAVAAGGVERRGEPTHAILVKADSPIQSARDLEGRTMATNALNNIEHLMQQMWLQNNGADPRRVSFVEIPYPQHPAAVAQGRVDATGTAQPFMAAGLSQGARALGYHYVETSPEVLIAYFVATGDWLGRNGDVAQRFARAQHRGNEFLDRNPDERRPAAVRHLNLSPELAATVTFEGYPTRIDAAGIDWWIDAGRRFGLVNNTLDARDFLYETVR